MSSVVTGTNGFLILTILFMTVVLIIHVTSDTFNDKMSLLAWLIFVPLALNQIAWFVSVKAVRGTEARSRSVSSYAPLQ